MDSCLSNLTFQPLRQALPKPSPSVPWLPASKAVTALSRRGLLPPFSGPASLQQPGYSGMQPSALTLTGEKVGATPVGGPGALRGEASVHLRTAEV